MGDDTEASAFDERLQVGAQLAFRGALNQHLAELVEAFPQGGAKRPVGEQITNGDAAFRLLDGEVSTVREDQGELLLVIGTPPPFPQALDENDPAFGRTLVRERADAIGELVIGHVDPGSR